MKDPDVFGVRAAEDPKYPGRLKLKKSILDEPTVVYYNLHMNFYFLLRSEMVSSASLDSPRANSSIRIVLLMLPAVRSHYQATIGLI